MLDLKVRGNLLVRLMLKKGVLRKIPGVYREVVELGLLIM